MASKIKPGKKTKKGPGKYPSHENLNADSSEVNDLMLQVDDMSPEMIRERVREIVDEMDLPENSKNAILDKELPDQRMLLKNSIFKNHGTKVDGMCI